MPSGYAIYRIDGGGQPVITDLDSIFEPRQSGDPVTNITGFVAGDTGEDLNQRYMPISEGETYNENVDFKTPTGADLRNVFAALGTTNPVKFVNVLNSLSAGVAAQDIGENVFAIVQTTLNNNGSVSQSELISNTPPQQNYSGTWSRGGVSSGVGNNFEVQYDVSGLVINESGSNAFVTVTNGAPSYTTISSPVSLEIRVETVGGSGNGTATITGSFTINVREIGETQVTSLQVAVNLLAEPI